MGLTTKLKQRAKGEHTSFLSMIVECKIKETDELGEGSVETTLWPSSTREEHINRRVKDCL